MVDTIKFRAWHKEEKVYYNNVYLLGNAILYSFENDNNFDHIADLDDVILEQYTGKDNIYVNDVVDLTCMGRNYQGVVHYNKDALAFEIKINDKDCTLLLAEVDTINKVLGNIHEPLTTYTSKFQAGDYVRVLPIKEGQRYQLPCYIDDMLKYYEGKVLKIRCTTNNGNYFVEGNDYAWYEDWLEKYTP